MRTLVKLKEMSQPKANSSYQVVYLIRNMKLLKNVMKKLLNSMKLDQAHLLSLKNLWSKSVTVSAIPYLVLTGETYMKTVNGTALEVLILKLKTQMMISREGLSEQ
jgi:hypothetical protein